MNRKEKLKIEEFFPVKRWKENLKDHLIEFIFIWFSLIDVFQFFTSILIKNSLNVYVYAQIEREGENI